MLRLQEMRKVEYVYNDYYYYDDSRDSREFSSFLEIVNQISCNSRIARRSQRTRLQAFPSSSAREAR